MIVKLVITSKTDIELHNAVAAAQAQLGAVVEQWVVTLRFRADEDCTPFDLAGALREVPGVRVEIEAELER